MKDHTFKYWDPEVQDPGKTRIIQLVTDLLHTISTF